MPLNCSTPLTLYSGHDQSIPQERGTDRVENGSVPNRTIRSTLIAILVLAMVLGVLFWLAATAITGRTLDIWEACVVLVAVLAVLEW